MMVMMKAMPVPTATSAVCMITILVELGVLVLAISSAELLLRTTRFQFIVRGQGETKVTMITRAEAECIS